MSKQIMMPNQIMPQPVIKNGLPAIHPGEFLREILQELPLSQSAFAKNLHVSSMRISHVLNGSRPISAELALRLGQALGQSPQYWLNLQTTYDLKTAQQSLAHELTTIETVLPLAA